MENNNFLNGEAYESVAKTVDAAIKNKEVPQEANKNHVLVGGVGRGGLEDYSFAFYNPHNARFYFDFFKWNFIPDLMVFERVNSSELVLKDFYNCRIVVKRNLVEVTNKVDSSRRFRIDGSIDARKQQVIDAVSALELEAIVALKAFVKSFGGSSSFKCVKMWIPDNKILHDKLVDSLPSELTFRNDIVKKVYNDVPNNVEFSSPVSAANAFRNLGLYDFAPAIADEVKGLHVAFDRFTVDALNPLTEQIRLHLKVQRETLKTLKLIQASVSENSITPNALVSSDQKLIKARRLLKEYGW